MKNKFEKCFLATLKTVEVDNEALNVSRQMETKVMRQQRRAIYKRIKYPANEIEAKRSIRQFVELFKKDGSTVVEESNEFYQMKKIQMKSTITKEVNPFSRRANSCNDPKASE